MGFNHVFDAPGFLSEMSKDTNIGKSLAAEHVPLGDYCACCTVRGVHSVTWPCALYNLAISSLRLAHAPI